MDTSTDKKHEINSRVSDIGNENEATEKMRKTAHRQLLVGCSSLTVANAIVDSELIELNDNSTLGTLASYRRTIFEQSCQHWSETDECYISKWISKDSALKANFPDYYSDSFCSNLPGTISISWTRETEPSKVTWSKDVLQTPDSLGKITLRIPFVVGYGKRTRKNLS